MKKLMTFLLCIIISLISFADNGKLIIKVEILSNDNKPTRIVVMNGFDTIVDKYVYKNYQLSLNTDCIYDISFTKEDMEKNMIVDKAPKKLYRFELNIDFILSENKDNMAYLLYEKDNKTYKLSVLNKGGS